MRAPPSRFLIESFLVPPDTVPTDVVKPIVFGY
jgi:hypothetical protein